MSIETTVRRSQTGPVTRRAFSQLIPTQVGPVYIEGDYTIEPLGLARIVQEIGDSYRLLAQQSVTKYLGPDPTKYTLIVDGSSNNPISNARLDGAGVTAYNQGSVEKLKEAFWAALNSIMNGAPMRTGRYRDSIKIRVNGKETASVDWSRVTAKSNIQIYSNVRYASALESIYYGKLLMAARNAALRGRENDVRASFTYRKPGNYAQQIDKSIRTGEAFTPLAVPVVEIGTTQSNVTNYVGNVSRNIRVGEKRARENLIERKILPSDRLLPKKRFRRAPKVGPNR